jgi:23S rRNA pseudouridine1911/1915/1917 synthase
VVTQEHPEARHALLGYRVLGRHKGHSLLEVNPKTGRTHQIRVQLASRGWPIAGDERYGEARQSPWADGAIALHARSLQLPHPTRPEQVLIRAPLPREWRQWAGSLSDVGETA